MILRVAKRQLQQQKQQQQNGSESVAKIFEFMKVVVECRGLRDNNKNNNNNDDDNYNKQQQQRRLLLQQPIRSACFIESWKKIIFLLLSICAVVIPFSGREVSSIHIASFKLWVFNQMLAKNGQRNKNALESRKK